MINYNDYRTHLKICEFLGKEPTGQFKKVYDYLTGLWDGMEIVFDSQSLRVVIQNEKDWLFRQNLKTGHLWCQKDLVWSFFQNDMGMEYPETQDFIKSAVEEHLKCKVGTPKDLYTVNVKLVEEHLKCKVETPFLGPLQPSQRWKNI